MYSGYYGTFVAHVFSLASASWSAAQVIFFETHGNYSKIFLAISQIFILLNSIIALFRYGNQQGYKWKKIHVFTLNLSVICTFSFIQIALLQIAKLSLYFKLLTALNVIPFLYNLKKLDYRFKFNKTDLILIINCLLFLYACLYSTNYYGIAFVISFIFGYFFVGDCGFFLDTEVPSIDIYQYVQCFLCYFTVLAFGE